LGPLEVLGEDGQPIALAGEKERILLASVALGANQVVSVDRLIDALWGEDPPATAANTLQAHVSRLRKKLAAAGAPEALASAPGGYLLRVGPGEVDTLCFEDLVRTATGEPAEAADRLGEALALWRGLALTDVPSDALRGERARLEELHRLANERRIEADLALGRHAELVGEIEAVVQADPLRETPRRQLMLALYRSGRQADALATYREAREVLAEELGIDPGPELRKLELAILNQAPELDAPAVTQEPLEPMDMVDRDSHVLMPLPNRIAVPPRPGVVGRETELAQIAEAVKRVAAASGREVVMVSGEAGLGKTTLVAEAAQLAFNNGAFVLFGHCEEGLAAPYQLFAESLGHYVAHAPEYQLAAHVEVHGSELVRLVPNLAHRIPNLPPSKASAPDTERFLLFAAAVGLLAMVSQHQLVVLVFDDLQWADEGSLQLLRHLAASQLPMNVVVLGTYRNSELSKTHPLLDTLAALHRHGGINSINLSGLDETGVVALMEANAGYTLDDAGLSLAQAVFRETDGNPFFVSEVLRHLSEVGNIYQNVNGQWTAQYPLDQIALPDSLRVVIGARVGRLGHRAGQVLSVASVIGRDFDFELLARASATSEDQLLDVLDIATAASLVQELADTPGHYHFAHALIQHTLYEELGLTRRARVHRRVAEALEDLCDDESVTRVSELARHWLAATQPIDLTKAIHYSRQAGDAALIALAPAEALRHYAQALDLCSQSRDTDPVLLLDLAIGLGTAQRQSGNPAFRETLLDVGRRAADMDDVERLVSSALANSRGVVSSIAAVDAEKIEILETALGRLSKDHPDRAQLLATLCSELTFGSPFNHLQPLADEAVDLALSSGDDAAIVRVLNHVFDPLQVPPLLDQSVARSTEALVRAERSGDPVLLFYAAAFRVIAAARTGEVNEMDRCMEIMGSLAERLEQPVLTWGCAVWRAGRAQIAGDPDAAERLATEALQIATDSGQPDATLLFAMQFMASSIQRGTIGDLVPLIDQVASDISERPPPSLSGVLAAAHVEGDRPDEARHLLEEFAANGFDLPMGQDWLTGMVAFAEAAIECGDRKSAGPLYDRLAPFADQWSCNAITAEGPVSHFLGGLAAVLGHYEEAETYFAQSAAFSARVSANFFAARTDLLWGKMLTERLAPGDTEKAWDLLTKAQTSAAEHGYGNVERRAAEARQLLHS